MKQMQSKRIDFKGQRIYVGIDVQLRSWSVTAIALPYYKVQLSMPPSAIALAGVQVVSSAIDRVKGSAYNAVAIDARPLHNSTKTLAEALQKAPGLKLREAALTR